MAAKPNFPRSLYWIVPFLLAVLVYGCLGYGTPRDQTAQVFALFGAAFILYYFLIRAPLTFKTGWKLALGLRLVFIGALPALSDDYFRFIWDGSLLVHGENPFLHLPSYYLTNPAPQIPLADQALFNQLNSPHYYSVYPPVCQAVFASARWLAGPDIRWTCVWLRLFIIMADMGSIFLIRHLGLKLGLPEGRTWWYAFNPLVVVELTGNLHFEAFMILFILAAFYLLYRGKTNRAAVFLGLAVASKMLPLMWLPFLIRPLGWKSFLKFGFITGLTLAVLFLPFLSLEFIGHIFQSLDLYFQKFEFNAGLYFALRWIGQLLLDFNPIRYLGPALSGITLMAILGLAFRKGKVPMAGLPVLWLGTLTTYFCLATVVHPWYLTTLVALAVFTPWRFAFWWSGLVIVSYAAYSYSPVSENLVLTGLEYGILFGIIWWEWRKNRQSIRHEGLVNL